MDTTTAVYGSGNAQNSISSVMQDIVFEAPPPPDFSANARIKSAAEVDALCQKARCICFQGAASKLSLVVQKWDTALEWKYPFAKWFWVGKSMLPEQLPHSEHQTRGSVTKRLLSGRASRVDPDADLSNARMVK